MKRAKTPRHTGDGHDARASKVGGGNFSGQWRSGVMGWWKLWLTEAPWHQRKRPGSKINLLPPICQEWGWSWLVWFWLISGLLVFCQLSLLRRTSLLKGHVPMTGCFTIKMWYFGEDVLHVPLPTSTIRTHQNAMITTRDPKQPVLNGWKWWKKDFCQV